MTTLTYAGIFVTAVLSCVWDLRERRIPNPLTLGSALLGLCVYGSVNGLGGIAFSAAGWATGLILFLPWFLAGGMGGGDVKLLAAFGAWLGPALTVRACLFAMLAGGLLALVILIREGRLVTVLAATMHLALPSVGQGAATPSPDGTSPARGSLAYAVPVAVGVGVALWLQ
jgi:prepilin peptidase CpaA